MSIKKIPTINIELDGMPPMDDCGRAATEYIDILERIEKLKDDKNDASDLLIQAMRRADRVSIKIGKKTIVMSHIDEADVIKVKAKK